MKLTNLMIGIAIMSGLSIALGVFFYNFAGQYGIQDVNNLSTLNKIPQLSQSINETATKIQQQQSLIEAIFTTAGLLWGVFVQMISLPVFFLNIISDTSVILSPIGGLPIWFVAMLGAIVSIIIIYKIASILSNREEL